MALRMTDGAQDDRWRSIHVERHLLKDRICTEHVEFSLLAPYHQMMEVVGCNLACI